MALLAVIQVIIAQVIFIAIIVLFLKVLLNKQLIDCAIQDLEYLKLEDKGKSLEEITVLTHKPLKVPIKKRFVEAASKNFRREIPVIEKQDRSLMGGVVVLAGPARIDFCLRTRLKKLRIIK